LLGHVFVSESNFVNQTTFCLMTLSRMTLGIKTFSIMVLILQTLGIKTLSIKKFSTVTLSLKALSIKIFSILALKGTHHLDIQHNDT
jgi:hypothetical protein